MTFGEADTRAKLIDPALHKRGWTENLIRREETSGSVEIIDSKPRKRSKRRVDYFLRNKVGKDTQQLISDDYYRRFQVSYSIRKNLEEEVESIQSLPSALLRMAFSGGL